MNFDKVEMILPLIFLISSLFICNSIQSPWCKNIILILHFIFSEDGSVFLTIQFSFVSTLIFDKQPYLFWTFTSSVCQNSASNRISYFSQQLPKRSQLLSSDNILNWYTQMKNYKQLNQHKINILQSFDCSKQKMSSTKEKNFGLDLATSRLSSISEQSNEIEGSIKTSQALLNVYYQLYAISYVQLPMEPRRFFHKLSDKVQKQISTPIMGQQKFREQMNKKKGQNYMKYLKQKQNNRQKIPSRILSNKELSELIKQKMDQTPKKHREEKQLINTTASNRQLFSPTSITHLNEQKQCGVFKQLDQTAEQKILLSEILSRLNNLDEQRAEIKYQIFTEQNSKVDGLYFKWTNLHQKMKQTLQAYINKIWSGKTLQQLYNDFDPLIDSKKIIQGCSENQLFCKLDVYLQSLFLDERQILLYRNASQKSRSIRTFSSKKANRKKITHN